MKRLIFFTLVILFASCQSSKVNIKKVDRTNPKNVAVAVLKSYQKKNLETLKELATRKNATTIQKFIVSEKLIKERRIFSGKQWEKIEKWDGKIREIRFSDDLKTAYAMFDGSLEGSEFSEITVVQLLLQKKEWRFDNIASYTKRSFDSLGYVME